MIASEHTSLSLFDFSMDWTQVNFDHLDLNKPISKLTLKDISWCLRKRKYSEQVLDLIVDKIIDHWSKIDQYYSTEICEWYEEIIKEIITIPFSFWDTKHKTHSVLCEYILKSNKRIFGIEESIIKLFISYKPQPICCTKEDSDLFESDLSLGIGMDIAGNIIEAEKRIKKLKIAIMNDQSVFVESEFSSISSEEELIKFVTKEYFAYGDIVNDIIERLQREKKIKTEANKGL